MSGTVTADPGSGALNIDDVLAKLKQQYAPASPGMTSPGSPAPMQLARAGKPPSPANSQVGAAATPPPAQAGNDIVTQWMQAGYPKPVAEGIARRAKFESSDSSGAVNPEGTSFGLYQHTGPRFTAMWKDAVAQGLNPADPKVQTAFAQKEIEKDPALKARLMNAKTPEEAYDIFTKYFERPANVNDHGPGGLGGSAPGSLFLPAMPQLPPGFTGKGAENFFRDMQQKQFGDYAEASEHLKAARAAEADMLKAAPQPIQTQPAQTWGSMAMILAAFGGLLTHTPLTTSLNAMAGVLNAVHANDAETTKEQFVLWKASHETAMKMVDLQLGEYRDAIERAGNRPKDAVAELQALAAAYKFEAGSDALKNGDLGTFLELTGNVRSAASQARDAALNFQAQMTQGLIQQKMAQNPSMTMPEAWAEVQADLARGKKGDGLDDGTIERTLIAGDPTLADDPDKLKIKVAEMRNQIKKGTEAITDDAATRIAESYLSGDQGALFGMARSQANITKVENAIARIAKDRNLTGADISAKIAEFKGMISAERTLGTRMANLGLAAAEAKRFAPMVLQTSDAIDRTSFPTINSLELAVQKGTGGEKVVRFIDALNAFKNAYAQVVTRGGQSTDDSRRRADEVLEANWTKGQIRVGIQQLMLEIDAAQKAPGDVQKEIHATFAGQSGEKPASSGPSVGEVHDGYKFKGGDPANPASWEKVP